MNLPPNVRSNISLASFTSWQIGGEADFFAEPKTLDELKLAYGWAMQNHLAVSILGGGSNVLISDDGVMGLVMSMRKLDAIQSEVVSNNSNQEWFVIQAEAGVKKSELLKAFLKQRLDPALFLAGLPGDVGGGVVMNAGVAEDFNPREFGELVQSVKVLRPDLSVVTLDHDDLNWTYRHSSGWEPGIIIQAQLRWPNIANPVILDKVKEANRIRLQKQPLDMPSCGSVFKNPPGQKAAELIDKAGLKGYTLGEAQVSNKHANFIVNLGKAKAKDTWGVIKHVQAVVFNTFQVHLETEVVRFGRW